MTKQTSAHSKPDLADLLAASLPPPTPPYDERVEITARALAKRNNWSTTKAQLWLQEQVSAGAWTCRDTMVNGRKAMAYRPVAK